MSFQDILGQERAKQILQQGLRNNQLSHAYLFSGPPGTGKVATAFAFAKAILCIRQQDDACGECIECRKAEHGNHPGLLFIEPDGATIKIEQIRFLQKQFAYRNDSGQAQLYMIHHADRMTDPAANSLLKFLEEPYSRIIAILITEQGQALLPTIRSRTQAVPFTPAAPGHLAHILLQEGFDEVLVRPAVHLCAGLDAAKELIQLNGFAEMRNVMIQLAKECASHFAAATITAYQRIFQSELANEIALLLDLWVLWFKDMIQIHCGRKDQLVFIDEVDWLTKQAFKGTIIHWTTCMERAVEARKRLRSNVNPQLVLEQYMSQIQEG